MRKTRFAILILALALVPAAHLAAAGAAPQSRPPAKQDAAAPGRQAAEAEPKPYAEVVTADFETQTGLFKVHTHKSTVLFEIPAAELDKDQLLVVQIQRSPNNTSYPGQGVQNMVVRWEKRDHKILLRAVSHANIADPNEPINRAVEAMNTATIMMVFPIEAYAEDGAPVISAARFFTSDVNEVSVKRVLDAASLDSARTFLDRVRVFPLNLNAVATQTFNPKPPQPPAGMPAAYASRMPSPPSPTAVVHYSFVKLPDKPMMGRLADDRVGFFSHGHTDYGRPDHETVRRNFIARWRLEKKNAGAAKSEPVKPIVFYIDPATPKKWVPYVKKGVEAWQPAFEEAGFLKAIQAREAPSADQDPDWCADDARYSVIRWVPSTVANAMGPHVSDPRSGEILEADVEIYHNVQQLARDWYWTQAGPLDPACKTLPLPDELMGRILIFIVTHEVGHSLGLPHNFKASATYPIARIRDKSWVRKNSHVPTLMDYSRFNYVAQPEDGIDPADLIPKIGPYDVFSIKWGYTPIPAAKSPDDEKPTLHKWCRVQDDTPWLRFNTAGARGTDPGEQSEAVGDIDAVEATGLGFRNLKRVVDMLPGAVLKAGEDYAQFTHMYDAIWSQARLELGHVVNIVGGYDSEPKVGPARGVRFAPIPEARQREAVKFLNDNLFATPGWLMPAEVLRKIEPTSGQARLVSLQQGMLDNLLRQNRVSRLQEHEAILGAEAYTMTELLADLRSGVFTELTAGEVKVDPYRRNLQRAYIDLLGARLNPPPAAASAASARGSAAGPALTNDDSRGAIRAELKTLRRMLVTSLETAGDAATRVHFDDLADRIDKTLNPQGSSR